MVEVIIKPLADWARKVNPRLWPSVPPIFTDIGPEGVSERDKELARELFTLLDTDSRSWYLRA